MNELQAALKIALANSFVSYFRAQSYHWNYEGSNFSEMHNFFGGVYEEVYSSIDDLAERIRIIGDYTPSNLSNLLASSTIDDKIIPLSADMLKNLAVAIKETIISMNKAFELANDYNKQGLADYLSGRIDALSKHEWMIRSYTK